MLFVRSILKILLTIAYREKKTVPPINDAVQLSESRVLFNITFRGH